MKKSFLSIIVAAVISMLVLSACNGKLDNGVTSTTDLNINQTADVDSEQNQGTSNDTQSIQSQVEAHHQ